MSGLRPESAIRADITVWESARTTAAAGKTIQITTSAGTRLINSQSVTEISKVLQELYRELAACLESAAGGNIQGLHNFALSNFNNGAQR